MVSHKSEKARSGFELLAVITYIFKEYTMEKFKRIAALLAVVVLIVCALLTLIFAFMGNEAAWKASAYCMVIIPIMIYIMMWLAKLLENRG